MRGDGDDVDIDTGGRRQADRRRVHFIDERGAVGFSSETGHRDRAPVRRTIPATAPTKANRRPKPPPRSSRSKSKKPVWSGTSGSSGPPEMPAQSTQARLRRLQHGEHLIASSFDERMSRLRHDFPHGRACDKRIWAFGREPARSTDPVRQRILHRRDRRRNRHRPDRVSAALSQGAARHLGEASARASPAGPTFFTAAVARRLVRDAAAATARARSRRPVSQSAKALLFSIAVYTRVSHCKLLISTDYFSPSPSNSESNANLTSSDPPLADRPRSVNCQAWS